MREKVGNLPERYPPTRERARRRLGWAAGALLALSIFPAGCEGSTTQKPKEVLNSSTHYALTQRSDGSVIDQQFLQQTGQQIAFGPQPNYSNWSIGLGICLKGNGMYDIYSREVVPNARDLVNQTFAYANNCENKHPVIDVHDGEIDDVLIGISPNSATTTQSLYTKMREYEITRIGGMLHVELKGLATVDPSQIHPNPNPD